MSKKKDLRRPLAMAMAASMVLGSVPYHVMAAPSGLEQMVNEMGQVRAVALRQGGEATDATSSATYYTKPNWEARIKDKSRWKVEDDQSLVRVSGSDPLEMNDIDYDGMFINANGRYVIRLVYKEKSQAVSAVWHRAIINFGDLDQYIDFNNSYVVGRDGTTKYKFDPLTGTVGRGFDLRSATGDRTNNRKNLPINLVLKDGVTLDNLPKKNYIVQMRITNSDYKKVYAYAPKGTSMDYSTYTKTTSVSLSDKVNNLFIKGGLQSDSNNATNQEFFMSEFIANPDQYKDASNTGIIRTQYMGQRAGSAATPTVGDEPIAFTQVFDANLLNYLKKDDDGYVAYVKVLTDGRVVSPYSQNFGIKRDQINVTKDAQGNELAYVVIGPEDFKKDGVKVVTIPKHDQYTMLSGFYITAIDYVVDKSKFEDTFAGKTEGIDRTRKLNYTMMSGWTNPNLNGWVVYEKPFTEDFVVQEGDSFMIDAGTGAKGKQIMLKVGGEQGMIRKPQGYYNGYNSGKSAIDNFEEIADGVFKIGLREGATVKKGQKLKIYMPYTSSYNGSVNFLQMHNGTKKNEGAATLTLQKDRNINMHLYTGLPRGASFKLKYTLKGGTEQKELVFTKPKGLGTFWQYTDSDRVLTGIPNTSLLATAGNFYIDTTKLEPGKDIIVEAYDEKGNMVADKTSSFKYITIDKANEAVKYLTWTDHSDKKAVLSINKSLYTPYQVLFTNDYADGVDDFYKDPRAFTGSNDDFKKDTTQILGYTRYDDGKVRTLYEGPQKLFGKVEAASDEYNDKGDLTKDNSSKVTIKKENVFDPQFTGAEKTYKGYAYTFDLNKMLPYHSDDKTETKLTLLKDMKFVSNASDGSSLPSDLLETRVRARVLFDANTGQWDGGTKKEVKIVPDNVNFYGEDGYKANGFEGANVQEGTGDKFPAAPKLEGKNFLGWVTEEGKNSLASNTVSVEKFNNLPKEQVFNAETPVTKHLVVYAIYSEEKAVTFDANGGTFGDKEQIIVKTDSNTVTAPTENPTKTGYTFKGWAADKNATTADTEILKNVTDSKTVYAVWEKISDEKLDLTAPAKKVPVQDKTDLTEGEKTKVKDAVKEANAGLGLTNEDITVEKDGKVIVNKDNKTGEIPADQTVTQKEVLNKINPPEKPVEVNNPKALNDEEKGKVKDAIIAANPDLKLTKDDITVDPDGKVTVNKGGKVGEVPADKTVVEADKVIKLTAPEKVEVKDVNNLTKAERDKVAEAVKKANKTKLSESAVVNVDGNGNVTVTDGDKKGTLDADKTIKPFDRTGKNFNDNIKITEVSDKDHLTEAEKQAVREAVKAANPDLAFKNSEIQVDANGKVTVPMGKNESGNPIYKEIAPEKTVKDDDANTTISLKAPAKTYVQDPSSLTEADKTAVEAAVRTANPTLPEGAKVTVANDGSVTVTSGSKVGTLAQADTVVKKLLPPKAATDEDGGIVVAPRDNRTSEIQVTYTDPNGDEQTVIAKKGDDGNWKIDPAVDGVTVNKDSGLISIPTDKIKNETDVKAIAKDGDNTSEGNTVKSEDKQAPAAPEVVKNDDGNITVTPPTDKDTKTVTIKYTDKDGNPTEVKATKGVDGTWKLADGTDNKITIDDDGKVTVPAEITKPGTKVSASATDGNNNTSSEVGVNTPSMADNYDPKVPAKTPVANPAQLTQEEKNTVKKAIEDANKDGSGNSTLPVGTDITIGEDGAATITYSDGSTDTFTGYKLVEKVDKTELKKEVDKKDTTQADVKYTNASQDKKDAYDSALAKADKALKDPMARQKDVDDALKQLKEAEAALDGQASNQLSNPAKVAVKDPANLTKEEKQAIKDAVKKANPTLQDSEIVVNDDGSVTVTKAGEEPKTIGKDKTVSTDVKAPAVTEVANPSKLTDDEKTAVKDAVKKANTDLTDDQIEVKEDGTVVVKKDGKETTIPASDVVKKKGETPAAGELKDPAKVAVKDPANLTKEEKQAIKDAVKKANPTLQDSEIVVNDDGSVTVTKAGEEPKTIGKDKTVSTDVKAPAVTEVANPSKLTDDEKTAVKDAVKKANTDLTDDQIEVKEDGTVVVKKDGKETTIPASDVVKKKGETPAAGELKDPAKVAVKDPANLTKEEKQAIKDAVKKANPTLQDSEIVVNDDGSVTVTKAGEEPKTIGKDKTVSTDVKAPAVTEVANPSKLTDDEKTAVKDAVKKANTDLTDDQIEVKEDGTVVVKKDGKETTIPASDVVKSKTGTPSIDVKAPAPVEVADPNHLTEAEKKAVEDAIKQVNPDLASATITVDDKGNVTIKQGNKTATLTPSQTVKGKAQGHEKPEAGRGSWFFFGNGGFGRTSQDLVQKETKQVTERGRHEAYMYGYTDGTFRPDANITRSEAAAMIARLKGYDLSDKTAPKFSDTKVGWFKAAINAVFKNGLMKGYQDGSFRPNEKITRAEFAQMIKNIDQANGAVASFKDVKGHWAEAAINQAYGNGRIKGYPDGTFKPDAPITRAEAVTIANSLMGRSVDGRGLKEKLENPTRLSKFSDLTTSHWAFYEIMEATNSHDFERRDKGGKVEDWLEINKK
ncbi:Parasporal protein [Urinicoccus massiliensis]|uniref:Parasporal protein n=1 Tax=Urinicoccus massiliensis TaxID=1723382 RepID=A0A8H2M433_9FIRM|nr:S-layer homology domain-containing protein [Urinicoccus massiliensis]VFB15796.1 Parasporal protein [Urinicoccus massiliensis]